MIQVVTFFTVRVLAKFLQVDLNRSPIHFKVEDSKVFTPLRAGILKTVKEMKPYLGIEARR